MRIASLLVVAAAGVAALAITLAWPRGAAQAQVGLPVGLADCSCTRGTALDAGGSRLFVHVCQCGAQQCVITAGTSASGSAVPQLAQSCR